MMGGRASSHWVGVRGYDAARDVLTLANPATRQLQAFTGSTRFFYAP